MSEPKEPDWSLALKALSSWPTQITGPKVYTVGDVWVMSWRKDDGGVVAVVYRVTSTPPGNAINFDVLASEGLEAVGGSVSHMERRTAGDYQSVLLRDSVGGWVPTTIALLGLEVDEAGLLVRPQQTAGEQALVLAGELIDAAVGASGGDGDLQLMALMIAGARGAGMSDSRLSACVSVFIDQYMISNAMKQEVSRLALQRYAEEKAVERAEVRACAVADGKAKPPADGLN